MANGKAPASIGGTYLRVTKLDTSGAPKTGAQSAYGTSSFVSFQFSANMEDGTEITKTGANGTTCLSFKTPTTLKDFSVSIETCFPDPVLTEFLGGGTLLISKTDSKTPIGWAAPAVGTDATPNGVGIEVWSNAIVDGKPHPTLPYYQYVFPYCKTSISGDRTIENDAIAWEFEGTSVGNAGFGKGPAAPNWPFPTSSPFSYAQVASKPEVEGYITVATP